MKNKKNEYVKISQQIGVSYFFNFLIIIFQPLLIALLTRILTLEEFGIYSLLFATISLLSVLFRFGIVEYIRSKIPGLKKEKRIKIIITLLFFWIFFLTIMSFVLLLSKKILMRLLNIQNNSFIFGLSIILIIFIAQYEIIESYLSSIKKIFLSSFLNFIIKCSWIIILFGFYFLMKDFSLTHVFFFWLIGVIISLGLSLYFIRHEIFYFLSHSLKLDFDKLKHALKFSTPLIFVISFGWIVEVSDRYMINHFLGKEKVAIYSLAYGLVTVLISIPIIFQKVVQPYFVEKWNLKKDTSLFFNIMLKYSLIMILPAIVGLFVLRKEIITIISGIKYIEAASLIPLLLPFSLFGVVIYIFDRTMLLRDMIKQIVSIYFVAAFINILFNLYFIPKIGIFAAAYSTVISYFLIFIFMFYFRSKNLKFKMNYIKIGRIFLASLFMGFLIVPINPLQYWSKIAVIILGIISYGLFLFIFKVFNCEEKELMLFIYIKFKKIIFK
jgi:O-antigen/teichoic acid export membrane protein